MTEPLDEKLTNSLILQLLAVLEQLEADHCTQLSVNTIDNIIVCSTGQDCLLVVPIDSSGQTITLNQLFLQVLARILTNDSVLDSVSPVLSRPDIGFAQSKVIFQSIAFQMPNQLMSDKKCAKQVDYWLDLNRSKFLSKFFSESITHTPDTEILTMLDYIYLCFLCNNHLDTIANSVTLLADLNSNCV